VSKINCKTVFSSDFWRNPGPGHLPLDSARGDVEFADAFAPVASLAVSFLSERIYWNLVFFLR